jgi:hypothetical protein
LSTPCFDLSEKLWGELWTSLASLLRSYTAAHGLNVNRQAGIVHDEERVPVRQEEKWLQFARKGARVTWRREDGSRGALELTQTGRLRSNSGEDEMDFAVEAWARELMQ